MGSECREHCISDSQMQFPICAQVAQKIARCRQVDALPYLYIVKAGGGEEVDPLHAKGVWAWIDNYCQAHPIEMITTAAEAFNRAHPH